MLILGMIWVALDKVHIAEPFKSIARVLLIVVAILVLLRFFRIF